MLMENGEKSKVNAAAIIFGILAAGFAGIGVIDLLSDGKYMLADIVPESLNGILPFAELGLALVCVIVIVISVASSKKKSNDDDDELSGFENNVFNYKENQKKTEKSNRYEQPDYEFPEELSEEYKEKIFGDKKSLAMENKYEEIEKKTKKNAGEYSPKADEAYINNMDSDFETEETEAEIVVETEDAILEEIPVPQPAEADNTPVQNVYAAEETSYEEEKPSINVSSVVDNAIKEMMNNPVVQAQPQEEPSYEINTAQMDLSSLGVAPETLSSNEVYTQNNLDTDTVDISSLENEVTTSAYEYNHETIDTETMDMSSLEQTAEPQQVYSYEQDLIDSDAVDTSTLGTSEREAVVYEYHQDTISTDNFDYSELDNTPARQTYTYDYDNNLDTSTVDISGLSAGEFARSEDNVDLDFVDMDVYGETTSTPKVYDFAKKAAEIAANKADENGVVQSGSAYLNSYLESYTKPSSNTLYGSAKKDDNDIVYQNFEEDVYGAAINGFEESNFPPQDDSRNLSSMLDGFTFSSKD